MARTFPYFSAGRKLLFAVLLGCAGAAAASDGLSSALDTARQLHEHLANGDIEAAALLSNAPRRRYEVLRDYRERVGEEEFKRVYRSYQRPDTQLRAEIAVGERRLLIWELAEIGRLAGEYYVEIEGRMLLDDVPSEERQQLRRLLREYRAKPLEQTD